LNLQGIGDLAIPTYIRGQYPSIEGNERTYFNEEFRKIQDAIRGIKRYLDEAAAALEDGDLVASALFTNQNTFFGAIVEVEGVQGITPSLFTNSQTFFSPSINVSEMDTGYVNVHDYGAVGDGSTDDTTAFTDAIAAVGSTGGVVWVHPNKRYYIANNLTVTNGVTIRGGLSIVGNPATNGNPGLDNIWNYGSTLKLLSTKTIFLQGGACLDGLLVLRSTMTAQENNAASYAGTAITIQGDDSVVINCMILGFNQAYTSSDYNRGRMERVNIDCVNGVLINNCADIFYLREVHCWPFGTLSAASPDTDWDTSHYGFRNGTAFSFTNICDICKITDCFSFGYLVGFNVLNPTALTLTGCCADGWSRVGEPSVLPNTIGFLFQGNADMITCVNCQVAAQVNAFYIDLNDADQEIILTGCRCWHIEGNGVALVEGSVTVSSCVFRGVDNDGWGIANLGSGHVIAIGNRLDHGGGFISSTTGSIAIDLGNV
jgi:hypothetical protein